MNEHEAPGAALSGAGGTLTATTVAQALTTDQRSTSVVVQADPDNTNDVYVGYAAAQPLHLKPGDVVNAPVGNANLLYVKTTVGTAVVNWLSEYST